MSRKRVVSGHSSPGSDSENVSPTKSVSKPADVRDLKQGSLQSVSVKGSPVKQGGPSARNRTATPLSRKSGRVSSRSSSGSPAHRRDSPIKRTSPSRKSTDGRSVGTGTSYTSHTAKKPGSVSKSRTLAKERKPARKSSSLTEDGKHRRRSSRSASSSLSSHDSRSRTTRTSDGRTTTSVSHGKQAMTSRRKGVSRSQSHSSSSSSCSTCTPKSRGRRRLQRHSSASASTSSYSSGTRLSREDGKKPQARGPAVTGARQPQGVSLGEYPFAADRAGCTGGLKHALKSMMGTGKPGSHRGLPLPSPLVIPGERQNVSDHPWKPQRRIRRRSSRSVSTTASSSCSCSCSSCSSSPSAAQRHRRRAPSPGSSAGWSHSESSFSPAPRDKVLNRRSPWVSSADSSTLVPPSGRPRFSIVMASDNEDEFDESVSRPGGFRKPTSNYDAGVAQPRGGGYRSRASGPVSTVSSQPSRIHRLAQIAHALDRTGQSSIRDLVRSIKMKNQAFNSKLQTELAGVGGEGGQSPVVLAHEYPRQLEDQPEYVGFMNTHSVLPPPLLAPSPWMMPQQVAQPVLLPQYQPVQDHTVSAGMVATPPRRPASLPPALPQFDPGSVVPSPAQLRASGSPSTPVLPPRPTTVNRVTPGRRSLSPSRPMSSLGLGKPAVTVGPKPGPAKSVISHMEGELRYLRSIVRALTKTKAPLAHRERWTETLPDSVAVLSGPQKKPAGKKKGKRKGGVAAARWRAVSRAAPFLPGSPSIASMEGGNLSARARARSAAPKLNAFTAAGLATANPLTAQPQPRRAAPVFPGSVPIVAKASLSAGAPPGQGLEGKIAKSFGTSFAPSGQTPTVHHSNVSPSMDSALGTNPTVFPRPVSPAMNATGKLTQFAHHAAVTVSSPLRPASVPNVPVRQPGSAVSTSGLGRPPLSVLSPSNSGIAFQQQPVAMTVSVSSGSQDKNPTGALGSPHVSVSGAVSQSLAGLGVSPKRVDTDADSDDDPWANVPVEADPYSVKRHVPQLGLPVV